MSANRSRALMFVLLATALVITLACTVTPVATEDGTPSAQALATPTPEATATTAPTATSSPTADASPTATAPATETVPAGTPTPIEADGLAALADITPEPGQRVVVSISEAELNESLTLDDLAVQGATIGDPAVTLEEGAIVARMDVDVENPRLSLDVILRGSPNVVDGELYLAVDEVLLGESTDFFTRLIAQPMIDSTIREYSGEDGIPVPIAALEGVEIESATVEPGILTIEGQAE